MNIEIIYIHTQLSFNNGLKYDYERKDMKGNNFANKLEIKSKILIANPGSRNKKEKHTIFIILHREKSKDTIISSEL